MFGRCLVRQGLVAAAAGLSNDSDSFWVQVLQQTAPGVFVPLAASLTDNLLVGNNNGLAVFTNHTGSFEWLNAGLWDLLAGTYRIQITMRESGVGIDQLRIGQYRQAPGDDRVDIRSIGGIVEINGGSGDDSFYVNYYATGVQTISETTFWTPFSNITAPRFYGVGLGVHF